MAAYQPVKNSLDVRNKLFQFGYQYAPGVLKLDLVDDAEQWVRATAGGDLLPNAVQAYQEWFKDDLDQLAQVAYGRDIEPDGEAGALTEMLLNQPRCAFPDYPHPTQGFLDADGEALGAAEEANHPDSCRREMTKSLESGYNLPGATFDDLMEWESLASSRWMDHFKIGIKIDNSLGRNAHRWIIAARLGGSILADQYLAQNNCRANLRGRYDSDRRWTKSLYLPTAVHEEGHFWGCPHIRNSEAIMYPSIHRHSIEREGKLHAADISLMESLGYERGQAPPPPPPTPNLETRVAKLETGMDVMIALMRELLNR